ncbi:bacillithiol biosynthesis cysteine-adding enzyme BshC [Terriglobus aquaticus]|uniref:Putative cysteine ligase BshC n=1 Tax=Terriglobus aquaticus TaxID=940139 RepID=A0ABW9KJQ8_9BACT|nr:bacillithiol biosynthesis cysteine-adding enzyme BshC [Terriglobus aquaticus]
MTAECYPISVLPHLSRIFEQFTELRTAPADAPVRQFYPTSPWDDRWKRGTTPRLQPDRAELVRVLREQNEFWGCGDATRANLDKLAAGARAVVTGQQVGLFGGPLLTLMKAATAIRKAQVASEAGMPHVPVFWMATEDHDLDEVNQAAFLQPGRNSGGVEVLRSKFPHHGTREVGSLPLGEAIAPVVERAEELLGFAPIADLLREYYTPGETLASAFAKLITALFRDYGLIVIDASRREFHAMGAPVLRYAIEHADELHDALLHNTEQLVAAGFHAQVLIAENSSLLFVVDEQGNRLSLRRVPRAGAEGREWKAGARVYSQDDLLALLDSEPERLSPNALLRPVFQDALLPTSAYVGGPAEIAYFAQCRVLYERILGVVTPVLPRLSATLVDAPVQAVMEQHELSLRDALQPEGDLLQKLAARAIPIEGKRKIAAAGNALDAELTAVTQWMSAMDESLGRSAGIAANKMRYQMNRLRRMAANWQVQKEGHLAKHAAAVSHLLFPDGHPQERFLSGAALLARTDVDVPRLLVENAEQDCPGHRVFAI